MLKIKKNIQKLIKINAFNELEFSKTYVVISAT